MLNTIETKCIIIENYKKIHILLGITIRTIKNICIFDGLCYPFNRL